MTSRIPRQISDREKALVRYFRQIPPAPTYGETRRQAKVGAVLTAVGLFFALAAPSDLGRLFLGGGSILMGIVLAARGAFVGLREKVAYERALVDVFPQPADAAVDQWREDGLARLGRYSLELLTLTAEELESDIPPIIGPVIWLKEGLMPEDIVWKVGADGVARFGVYDVSYLWLAKHRLAIFRCDYDMIRDVAANERTHEFYYQDIVSVATHERSSSVTLRTGDKLILAMEFRISVANDRYFSITFDAAEIRQLTGAEIIPETGAEKAVFGIRKRLQEMKGHMAHLSGSGS